MSRLLSRPLLAFAMLVAADRAVAASEPVRTDHLQSRLVAESTAAVPGTRLALGLLLEHDPKWHTYWRNPGDSGLPTKLDLVLPDGVVAEPIDWPHPGRFEVGGIANFGYGERRLLPVAITIPADYAADTLPVTASASWLVCEEECIPGKAEYAFELPVAPQAEADERWAGDFAAARADRPKDSPASLVIADGTDAVVLTLRGLDASVEPAGWHWFPETALVVANGVQPQWQRADDGWRATWAKSEYFATLPADVALVAVERDGTAWRFAATPALAAAVPTGESLPADAKEPLVLLAVLVGGLLLIPVYRSLRRPRTEETDK